MAKRVIYHPPSRQAIEAYARKACEKLAERDVSYLSPRRCLGICPLLAVDFHHLGQTSYRGARNGEQT